MKPFVALVALVGSAAADCPHPRATLEGDPAAVASVTKELVKLGVDVGPPVATSCKSVSATVELDRDSIAVAVKTGSQSEGRTVSDPAIAASWIDSWLTDDDFGGPMFQTKLASARVVSANPDIIAAVDVPAQKSERGIAVSAAFDQSWMFDGSRWTGVSAGVCGQFGALCIGARGRYAAMSELYGQTAAARSDMSVLATASYEKQIGRAVIMPELGLGVGRMATSRIDGCRKVQTCDPNMDPHCTVPPVDEDCIARDPEHAYTIALNDNLSGSTVTPRASAALRIAISIADHLWLDGSAAMMLAPFSHTGAYELPMNTPPPFGIEKEQLALPGESIGTFELGIGLRWGSR